MKPQVRKTVQYDLLTRGLSLEYLGTEAFTWYDFHVMVHFLQRNPDSELSRELHGPTWSIEAQLTAIVADHLANANWQRAGKKHAPKPKPIDRPWVKPAVTALGSKPIPISQFDDWWDSQAPTSPASA